MTDRPANWKKHLLRSSVPLEHEAARILSQRGFGVSADYSYHRLDGGFEKEFSVDVRGVKGAGGLGKPVAECTLDVFIECKYRDRGTTWLFLPQPKYSSTALYDVLQSVDLFSTKFVHGIPSADDPQVKGCYTAVEVGGPGSGDESDKARGRAIESQLRHGVRQLQYALPSLIALRTQVAAALPPEKAFPFFFVPILLTNAQLMVAEHTFGVSAVESADALSDFSTEVPYLIWSADLGPDFYRHCQRAMVNLEVFAGTKAMRAIEQRRKLAREASWALPSALARLIAADSANVVHLADFTNVLVANICHLGDVVTLLDKAFTRMVTTLKDEPLVKWD